MDAQYSNLYGDFTVTPNDSTKELVLSDVELPLNLSDLTFADVRVKRRTSAGITESIPTRNVSWNSGTLTLNDMASNFGSADQVAVYVTGEPRGFFVSSENTAKQVVDVAIKKVTGPEYAATPFNRAGTHTYYAGVNAETQLNSLWVKNNGTTEAYAQIHDGTAVPSTGGTPVYWYPVPAGSLVPLDEQICVSSGLAIGVSATKGTFSAVSTPSNIDMGGFYT